MSENSLSFRRTNALDLLRTGLYAGLAGGLAEILVVWAYSALTGGDAAIVARQVGAAIGFDGSSATAGIAIHLGLAAALGIGLTVALRLLAGRTPDDHVLLGFMAGSLGIVWMVNFFFVLPALSPGFVHLLPDPVTLASKLLFGLAAGLTLRLRSHRTGLQAVRAPWPRSAAAAD